MLRLFALSILALGVALAGCADLGSVEGDDDCSTSLFVTPSPAIVNQEVRVSVTIQNDLGGISTIDWRVVHDQQDVPFTGQGQTEISFTPAATGIYAVDMVPSSSGSLCPSKHEEINVVMESGENQVRLRVSPPPDSGIPPIDQIKVLPTGTLAYSFGAVVLEPGITAAGTVGRAAYLKLIPDGQPDAVVEVYANASGAFSTKVQAALHHLLVVPNDPAYPPQTFDIGVPNGSENITLSTGSAISGTVLRPNGSGLGGAKVQLFMNDASGIEVPSTIGTTAANGSFTLRAFATSGSNPRVVVTPPAGSGLPRLEATSSGFNFANPVAVTYGASLVTRDIGGTSVTRGAALANAKVTIAGTLPFTTAGTISTGGTPAQANGFVRIAALANGSGVLPSTLVPAADLFAVVESGDPGDAAVVGFDTTTTVPSTIAAPAMLGIETTVVLGSVALDGARVEFEPLGALGLAGVGPTVIFADASGTVRGALAAGAIYSARLSDPSKRGAPSVLAMTSAATLGSTILLEPALVLGGQLKLSGSPNPISSASVQVLCNDDSLFACEDSERDRPLGETASDVQGSFEVAVIAPQPR